MRVRLETAGGYVGLPRVAELDTDEVPSLDVGAVLAALSESEGGPPAPPSGPQPRYRLTVYGDGGAPRVVELSGAGSAARGPAAADRTAVAGAPGRLIVSRWSASTAPTSRRPTPAPAR